MGSRGPRPTPSRLLMMRGTYRPGRRAGEPIPPAGRPTCPKWLPMSAKAYWRRLMPILETMGVLSRADGTAAVRYVVYLAQWEDCQKYIAEHGTTYEMKDATGRVTGVAQYPQVNQSFKLAGLLAKLEAVFGLTPADRARVTVAPEAAADPSRHEIESRFFGVTTRNRDTSRTSGALEPGTS
jgi:P27 family predicted phage terminase small subunit